MKRIRITISISQDVASEVDRLIDGTKIRNRSHAIETLLSESLKLSSIKTAVILAGGKNVTNRTDAIKNAIKQLQSFGIFNMTIAVGFLGKELLESLNITEDKNISVHRSNNGTGGSLYELKSKLNKPFFVVNVNEKTEVDLQNLIKFHNQHRPIATIATKSLRELNGFYLLEPDIFNYIPKGFSSLEDEVFVKLTKEGKLLSYPVLT